MDTQSILTILVSAIFSGLLIIFLMARKKNEPLTFVEFFLRDTNSNYLHVLGARRIMPEEGDSFDIFEHYVFDVTQLKFTKGGSQRGKNLELASDFVKRSLISLSEKMHVPLAFKMREDEYKEEEILKVYRYEQIQSDTEVYEEMSGDSLVFINRGDGADHFLMIINRGGAQLKKYEMRGMNDYFFKTIYLNEKQWLCFLYRKQKLTRSGMAICIVNYNSGEMIFDDFVKIAGK